MINDIIKSIDSALANAGIVSLEDFPYWARLRQKTGITKTEENYPNYLRHLQNKIDSFPIAKSELQMDLEDTGNWSTIENLFNRLQVALESEFDEVTRLMACDEPALASNHYPFSGMR